MKPLTETPTGYGPMIRVEADREADIAYLIALNERYWQRGKQCKYGGYRPTKAIIIPRRGWRTETT
jgi:hypothetical protein